MPYSGREATAGATFNASMIFFDNGFDRRALSPPLAPLICVMITPELLGLLVSSASSRMRPSGFSSWRESVLLVLVVGDDDDMRSVVDEDFTVLIGE